MQQTGQLILRQTVLVALLLILTAIVIVMATRGIVTRQLLHLTTATIIAVTHPSPVSSVPSNITNISVTSIVAMTVVIVRATAFRPAPLPLRSSSNSGVVMATGKREMSASVSVCVAVCLPALAVFLVRLSQLSRDLSADNWQLGLEHLCPRASVVSPHVDVAINPVDITVGPSAAVANLHAVSPHAAHTHASVSRHVNASRPAGVAMTTVNVNIAVIVIVTPAAASCVAARHVTPVAAPALRGDIGVLMTEVGVWFVVRRGFVDCVAFRALLYSL